MKAHVAMLAFAVAACASSGTSPRADGPRRDPELITMEELSTTTSTMFSDEVTTLSR